MRPVARIAQSVEQGIENPRVLGSIPSPGTKFMSTDLYGGPFSFVKPARYQLLHSSSFNPTQLNSTRIKSLARVQMRVYPDSTGICTLSPSGDPFYGTY